MTGSAGWSYYAATEYILGIKPDYDCLIVDPCIPADWKEFSVLRVWRGGTYDIRVTNPNGVTYGVKRILLDGTPVAAIPQIPAGSSCRVIVEMG
jgi:N,N'-diacetylchitobiose phosphorylase